MAKDKTNRIRVQVIVEWPKGLLRAFGIPLKNLISILADLFHQIYLWLRGPWPWL
jgi:hypothetical protein